MPRLSIETSHNLDEQEALRRLTGKFVELKDTYRDQFSDLREEWDGNSLAFSFKAAGMKIAGKAQLRGSQVKLDADLPLAATLFKSMIHARVSEELASLLA